VTTLTVGVVAGVTPDRWVRVWRQRMPQVELRILPVAQTDAVAALADAAHLVFARLPVEPLSDDDADALSVIPLWTETPVVVAAKDHPVAVVDAVTAAELDDEELLDAIGADGGVDDAVLDLVAAGHGVARLPQSMFRSSGRRDLVAREVSDVEPTRVALVWRTAISGDLTDEFIGIVRGRTANSSRSSGSDRAEPERTVPPPSAPRAPGGARRIRPPARRSKRRGR